MSPYVAWKAGEQPGTYKYRLSGAVVHSGSLGGGHYVAFVRRGSRWYYISDSHVKVVSEASALSCQAYLLFYVRRQHVGATAVTKSK